MTSNRLRLGVNIDHVATSRNARGIMQLIPSTARLTARKHGLKYDTAWLLDDPSYNTQPGMVHLSDERKASAGPRTTNPILVMRTTSQPGWAGLGNGR